MRIFLALLYVVQSCFLFLKLNVITGKVSKFYKFRAGWLPILMGAFNTKTTEPLCIYLVCLYVKA